MGMRFFIRVLMITMLAGLLWGCGAEDQQVAEGGIGGTGITSGPINGFGSIIVNGVRFDVSQAEIRVEDEVVVEELLRPGMVVVIHGDVAAATATGTARRVEFAYDLIADIESVAADGSWFIAGGERVQLDPLTVIDAVTGADLASGQRVSVSSVANEEGGRLARYVMVNAPGEEVNSHFASDSESAASSDMVSVGPETLVEASAPGLAAADVAERKLLLAGLVSSVTQGTRFEVQGLVCVVSESTEYSGIGELVPGAQVVVEGVADAQGVVSVSAIRFLPTGLMPLQGEVEAVGTDGLSLAGVELLIDSTTLMLDSSQAALHRFSLADIAVGDRLKVFISSADAGLVLTRLERVDSF